MWEYVVRGRVGKDRDRDREGVDRLFFWFFEGTRLFLRGELFPCAFDWDWNFEKGI